MSFPAYFRHRECCFCFCSSGIFREEGTGRWHRQNLLTDLVIYVTLPGSIIKSFQIEFNHQILIACMTIAIAGIVIQTGSSVLGMFLYNHYGDSKRKCCSMPPSVPMREFWEILSRKGFSDRWE